MPTGLLPRLGSEPVLKLCHHVRRAAVAGEGAAGHVVEDPADHDDVLVFDAVIDAARVFANPLHDAAVRDTAPPPFDDSFWNGPPMHGVVLRGDLVEWTCDAVGWLAEVIADADVAARLGVRTPLLLTVARAASTD
jgi:hypothetical protein